MASYTFDDIVLKSGILKPVIINDDTNVDQAPQGRFWVELSELVESVEESGYGGILRVADMESELYDRGSVLDDVILNPSLITAAQADVRLQVGSVEASVMYGDIDLTTVEHPSYYDDQSSVEYHSTKFTTFSFLRRLEGKTTEDLRSNLLARRVGPYNTVSGIASIGTLTTYTDIFPRFCIDTIGVGTITWQYAYRAQFDDDTYAEIHLAPAEVSHWLYLYDFHFPSMFSSATIIGLEAIIHRKSNTIGASGIKCNSVKWIQGGATAGNEMADSAVWAFTEEAITIGGPTDLAGLTWAGSDIFGNANFGIAISVKNDGASSFIGYLDSIDVTVYYDTGAGTQKYFVKLTDLLDEAVNLMGIPYDASSVTLSQTFRSTLSGADKTIDELYLAFQTSDEVWEWLWNEKKVGSFMSIKDVKALLVNLAASLLAYPFMTFDPATGKVVLRLKQRSAGNVLAESDIGELLESKTSSFFGYDYFRVFIAKMVIISSQGSGVSIYRPSKTTEAQFQIAASKLDFECMLTAANGESTSLDDSGNAVADFTSCLWWLDGSDMRPIQFIRSGSTTYNSFATFLLDAFVSYWSGKRQIERKYRGTGLGTVTPVEILDRVTVNGDDYSITEIRRNLVDNTIALKAVLY